MALAKFYDGRVSAFFPDFSMTHLTRVQFIIGRNPGEGPDPSQDEIEAKIRDIVRTFDDDLAGGVERRASAGARGRGPARLCQRLRLRLSRELHARRMRSATSRSPSGWRRTTSRCASSGGRRMPETRVVMSFHHLGDPIPLSRRVPLLENLGFSVVNERTYRIARQGGPPLYRHDMTLVRTDGEAFDLGAARRLHDAVLAVWHGKADNDGFNALVLLAGLPWRRAALLRTIARYLRQTDIPYSLDYFWGTLRRYPAIATLLAELFAARFEPGLKQRERSEEPHREGDRGGARGGGEPRRRHHPARLPAGHRGDPAHRLLRGGDERRAVPRSR